MKLKTFNKFLIGLAVISGGLTGTILYNSNIHSSLVVENKVTSDISWSIDGKGNIWPTDRSKVSGEITIPDTVNEKVVTGIANSAFSWCASLTSVNIPSSVTSIGGNAFYCCSSLTSVTFAEDSQLTSIGDYAFKKCSSLTSITIPSSVTSIGRNAFDNCIKLTNVNFAKGSKLNSIGENAFAWCASLTNISIPNSVTNIDAYTFSNCTSLTSVAFAEGSQLTTIGAFAFAECSSLTSINIPSSVTEIYAVAFVNTTKLQDITFNWTGKILDDIIQKIKNPVHQRELTTWACIFANYNKKTNSFKDKINVNVHLPKGINNLDVEKYKNNFQGIRNSGSNIPDGIGLDPATTHWIYNSDSNSKLPLILGLTFGFIILIGIGSYFGYRYYKHRKNSK
ncbi:BspA-like protein [Candidatus Malacoplasma girerdii]|uniref:BspA-like protein n=1 Tax=Candidatus Malacoplasma girerdii TaxID=1318617 RepID=A0A097SSN5_9BACT|nr:BspA-like protein [Candidatus Malacoplasma girerdii]